MALRKLFGYEVKMKCPNCGFPTPVKVPRGTSVAEYVKEGGCKCRNCSCVITPKEYSTRWLK